MAQDMPESTAFCFSFGYDLTRLDLPRACPECAQPADPAGQTEAGARRCAGRRVRVLCIFELFGHSEPRFSMHSQYLESITDSCGIPMQVGIDQFTKGEEEQPLQPGDQFRVVFFVQAGDQFSDESAAIV